MTTEMTASVSARPRSGDTLRVVGASMRYAARALFRRLLGRRRLPSWGVGMELMVASTRGAWSVMTEIGVVRWRNVGDSLSPLRFDGIKPRFVRRADGAVDGVWVEPPGAGEPVMLYFHGGGFVFGSMRTHGELIGALARTAKARTLALDYRLAPEHPTPAAIDDAVAGYRHLLAQGVTPNRIVFAGDSAGGNLVLSALLALRDAGDPLPAAGVAISPWVDLDCSGASFRANAEFDYVGEEHCRLAASNYLSGADARGPGVSPLFARLEGLPPLLIHAGAAETLVDQIRAFAERAQAAGVDVTLSVYDDMVHVWHLMRGATPEGQRALDEIAAFVAKRTG